jgi:hypothetical protein
VTTPRGKRPTKYYPSQIPNSFGTEFIAWLKNEFSRVALLGGDEQAEEYVKKGDDVAVLGSGAATVNKLLSSDGSGKLVWVDPGSAGSATWGSINGVISNQTDLTPGNIGAATAAQGALAITALQPNAVITLLASGDSGTQNKVLTADGDGAVYWATPQNTPLPYEFPFYTKDSILDTIPVEVSYPDIYLPFFTANGTQSNIKLEV